MAENFDPEMMRQFVEALSRATSQVDEITQGQRKEKEEREKNIEAIKSFGKAMASTAAGLGKAMTSAGEGAGKYSGALDQAGNAAFKLGSNFGILGGAIGGVVAMFAKLVGAGFKQNDALLKTYRSLSEFGDLDTGSFRNLLNDLQKTGFAVNENADLYINAIKKVAPELSTFAGSVSEGRKQLVATFSGTLGATEKQLARFGYSTEEMFERTGSMMAQMSLSNTKQKLSSDQLNAMSVTYMTTLAELAELTGQSRDALEQQRKAQMNDLRWQLYLGSLTKEQAEQERNRLMMFESVYGSTAAQGYVSKVVNHGRTVDSAAANLNRMFGSAGFTNFRQGLDKGGDEVENFAEAMEKTSPILRKRITTFGKQVAAGNQYGDQLGINMGLLNGTVKGENIDREKLRAMFAKKSKDEYNTDIDNYTKRKQLERGMRNAFEQMLQDVNDSALPALTKFTEMVFQVAKRLATVLKSIGGKDYTKQFRDATDVQEDLVKEQETYSNVVKKINSLEKEKEEFLKRGNKEQVEAITKEQEQLRKGPLAESARRKIQLDKERRKYGGNGAPGGMSNREYKRAAEEAGEQVDLNRVLTKPQNRYGEGSKELEGKSITDFVDFNGGISGNKANFDRLSPKVQQEFLAMAAEYYAATNKKLIFTSGHRTEKEHLSIDSKGNPKGALSGPNRSRHLDGLAIDIDSSQRSALENYGILKKYKFSAPGNDPPHLDWNGARSGGYFNGPNSGYMVEQHGFEGTFNAKQLTALNNALTKTAISGGGAPSDQDTRFMDLMADVRSSLQLMNELQRRNNSTQEEILKHSKA